MQEKPNAQDIEASRSNSAVSMGNLSITQPPRRCYNNAHPKPALLCHVSSLSSVYLEHYSLFSKMLRRNKTLALESGGPGCNPGSGIFSVTIKCG